MIAVPASELVASISGQDRFSAWRVRRHEVGPAQGLLSLNRWVGIGDNDAVPAVVVFK